MNYLSVAEYDGAEKEALAWMPNRVVQAFYPVTFQAEGYPFRVNSERELFKYLDVMHELRFENDFRNLLRGGLTREEFAFLKSLSRSLAAFCQERFGKLAVARSAVLRMLNLRRHFRYLFGDRPQRVLEIGSGCGYLGAMLLSEGHSLAASDISQAFYLYQNHLWNYLSQGALAEWARAGEKGRLWGDGVSAVHIPWWELVRLNPGNLPECDLITCNHALCEMHPDSLAFTLKLAKAAWQGRSEGKAFVFEGWGYEKYHSIASVTQRFYQEGFVLVHNDPHVAVFAPAGAPTALGGQELPQVVNRQAWVLREDKAELEVLSERSFHPQYRHAPQNPLSAAILHGRQRDQNQLAVGLEEVLAFYRQLVGEQGMLTDDERFMLMIR